MNPEQKVMVNVQAADCLQRSVLWGEQERGRLWVSMSTGLGLHHQARSPLPLNREVGLELPLGLMCKKVILG